MFTGKFPAYIFALVGSLSAIISIVVCYEIAVRKGHEQRWPHTYISNTARHYPEFIYFRIATISGAVMTILSYLVNYIWMHSISRESGFNIRKYYPKVPLVAGITSTLCLFVSTATIDTGIMDMNIHVKAAGNFFIFSIISCITNTLICWAIYKKTSKITTISLTIKIIFSILLLYQLYLELYKTAGFLQRDNSDLSHIL